MKIKNLGPIKEANIELNKLNIFIGKNGTGKTIAAYAIYSFMYWFVREFNFNFIDINEVENIINGNSSKMPVNDLIDRAAEKAVTDFNSLRREYFISFFNNNGAFYENSSITIDKNDIVSLVLDENERQGWYYSWPFLSKNAELRQTDNSLNSSTSVPLIENRILSTYNSKDHSVDTEFLMIGNVGIVDKETRQNQFRNFKEKERDAINNVEIINRSIKNVIFNFSPVYLPAERIGINLFRTDLNILRLNSANKFNLPSNNNDATIKKYPWPIEEYIYFVNNSLNNQQRQNNPRKILRQTESSDNLMQKLVPGKFSYHRDIDAVKYQLPKSNEEIDFELLSSSLKSIFGLDLFIKNNSKGDWIFIDEPEMNLHPENQKIMADFLFKLLTADIRMVISTHSDYFIKEIINRGIESKLNRNKFHELINVYNFSNEKVEKISDIFEIDSSIDNFDHTTNEINEKFYELVEKIVEKNEIDKIKGQFEGKYIGNNDPYWYKLGGGNKVVSMCIEEENYKLNFSYKPHDDYCMAFRIEDFKEFYFGSKNKGPKDNDLTIIDDNIYQIEVKEIKNGKGQSISKQLESGSHWVKQVILWTAGLEDFFSRETVKEIRICIRLMQKRPSLARGKESKRKNVFFDSNKNGTWITAGLFYKRENKKNISVNLGKIIDGSCKYWDKL